MNFLSQIAEYCFACSTLSVLAALLCHSVFCLVPVLSSVYHSPSDSYIMEPYHVFESSLFSLLSLVLILAPISRLTLVLSFRLCSYLVWIIALGLLCVLPMPYLFAVYWPWLCVRPHLCNKALHMDPYASHLVCYVTHCNTHCNVFEHWNSLVPHRAVHFAKMTEICYRQKSCT